MDWKKHQKATASATDTDIATDTDTATDPVLCARG